MIAIASPFPDDERNRDASRKREKRQEQKLVIVPQCADRARREEMEANDILWLMYYFGVESGVRDPYWYEFTNQQRQMIEDFRNAILYGGDQAEAASRGEGKTTNLERMITKYTLQGLLSYSVLFQATGTLADNSLDSIKTALEENPLLLADYPEVCIPVAALENTPNRAHYQLVSGFRHDNGQPYEMASSRFTWCGQEAIFPKVPGSPSSGAIIATRGLDAAVRGLKKRGRRPQLAAIDDPDTEETARSEEQAKKLEERIDRSIAGLGSQKKPIARIMLCTCPSRISVAYKFTDPEQKPSWNGRRHRYLITPSDRPDLWDEYVQMRIADMLAYSRGETDDKHCRNSHRFYVNNQETMDAGAVVANPNRFDDTLLEDGTQVEISALQHYYNEVARIGQDAVDTEYDNDPPEEIGSVTSGISANLIQWRVSGYPKLVVPPECTVLSRGIDVQDMALHYVVKAWRPDATNYVTDYGVIDTNYNPHVQADGSEWSIYRAILRLFEYGRNNPHKTADGQVVDIGLTLIDSGWQSQAVYRACAEIGLGVFPAKGHGKSHGCASQSFSPQTKRTPDTRPGDGWYQKRQPADSYGVWLTHSDTDRWKAFEHARWLTAEGKPGAAYVYGVITDEERKHVKYRVPADVKAHHGFARHIAAEIETEEMVRGILKRFWKKATGRAQNHYLDASYLADVAASMLGIRLLGAAGPKALAPNERPTMAQLAGRK